MYGKGILEASCRFFTWLPYFFYICLLYIAVSTLFHLSSLYLDASVNASNSDRDLETTPQHPIASLNDDLHFSLLRRVRSGVCIPPGQPASHAVCLPSPQHPGPGLSTQEHLQIKLIAWVLGGQSLRIYQVPCSMFMVTGALHSSEIRVIQIN